MKIETIGMDEELVRLADTQKDRDKWRTFITELFIDHGLSIVESDRLFESGKTFAEAFTDIIDKAVEERLNQAQLWLKEMQKKCESDPEMITDPFLLKWRDDDALMCLSSFIDLILGVLGEDNDPLVSERSFWEPEKAQLKTEEKK